MDDDFHKSPNKLKTHLPSRKSDNRNNDKDLSKLSSIIKCYKCQSYRRIAAICTTLVKIVPTDLLLEYLKPELEEFIYYADEGNLSDFDDDLYSCDDDLYDSTLTPTTLFPVELESEPELEEFGNNFALFIEDLIACMCPDFNPNNSC